MMDFITSYVISFVISFINLVPVTVVQSLILSFLVLAIMIPFRILNFPDLTSEGAYPLGGCVGGLCLFAGVDPFLAIIIAMAAGFIAGCITAYIHLRFRIHPLLAGILMVSILYSINLHVLGRSNLPLFNIDTIFSPVIPHVSTDVSAKIIVVGLIAALVFIALFLYFKTEKGSAMRAVGANPDMAEAQGINVWAMTIGGIGLAGSFAALGGAIMAQSQGFSDVSMGFGILINGLASLMVGEAIVGKKTITRQLLAPFVGTIVYYQLISVVILIGLPSGYLKMVAALFVLLMLAAPTLRSKPQGHMARDNMKE